MTREAQAIAQALLDHLHYLRKASAGRLVPVAKAVIPYGTLCERANVPDLTHAVGQYLAEVAEWCKDNGWPPLNSLAVNRNARMPGHGYDGAAGCSVRDWPAQAEACIAFGGYPEHVSDR